MPAYCLLLTAACVAARIAWGNVGGPVERDIQNARQYVRQMDTALSVAKKDLASLQTRQRMVATLIDQPDWAAFLQLVGKPLGPNLVLREAKLQDLSVDMANAPRPPNRLSGHVYKLELRGLAKSQTDLSNYVKRLEETTLFDEVRLLRSGREPFLTGTATNFEVECRINEQGGT
jgi:hypothetical protein